MWSRWVDPVAWSRRGGRRRQLAFVVGWMAITGVTGFAVASTAPPMLLVMLLALVVVVTFATAVRYPMPKALAVFDVESLPPGSIYACALCGHACLGGFYVGVPFEPGVYMHSVRCGPAFGWMKPIAEPTHERLADGSVARREGL